MAKSRATQGSNSQFTYDFGISIAQGTVNKIAKLTGATLTLASAFYALRNSATQYVNTLRENTLIFGGVLSTMKAMEDAQNRLIKGQSYFNMDDQLKGMHRLMSVGVEVGENLEWINKAAHATGKSYAEFSGMIASAIQGNSQALVDAGLMTQRATRIFDKYAANTVMRQQAILNFVKNHKGLMNAIKNDFETIQDQVTRIKATWQEFLRSIVGKPNDPNSFYGQIVSSMKMVATALANNMEQIKRYGYVIGQTLGWVIKQIGHFVVWVGQKSKKAIESVWKVTEDYQEKTRSMLVWLEFWKLKIVDFFKEYGNEIKNVLKLLVMYKVLKGVFVIGNAAIKSVMAYRAALLGTMALQKRYMASMGPGVGKVAKFFQSLAVWMPKWLRGMWIGMGKFFANAVSYIKGRFILFGKTGGKAFWGAFMKVLTSVKDFLGGSFDVLGYVLDPIKKYIFGRGPKTLLGSAMTTLKFFIKALHSPIKLLGVITKSVKGLIGAVKLLRVGFLALFKAFGISNPVGWIMLAIAAIVVLYNKFKSVRVLINNAFKFLWEWWKLLYNISLGVIVLITAGFKRLWGLFKEYVWNPVVNFFSNIKEYIGAAWSWISDLFSTIGKWIGDMWGKFKDTSVGRFVNKWIVGPIEYVYKLISKIWNSIISGVGGIVKFISGSNSSIAKWINNFAKSEGLSGLAIAAEGGNYDTNDETNYIDKAFSGFSSENPLASGSPSAEYASSETPSSNLTFNKGAIQIVVQKGDSIDETKLARKVRQVIIDLEREGNVRGGML